jgi:type IV secretion system protein VirB6
MSLCPAPAADLGLVRDILTSVDCNARLYSLAGYAALTGPGSPLPGALTAMMTIYVALLGHGLLFGTGGTRLSETPLIAVKLGVILTLTLGWSAFETLVFRVQADAPLAIARVISQPMAAGEPGRAGDPLRALQGVYDELNADGADLSQAASRGQQVASGLPPAKAGATTPQAQAAAASGLWRAAGALLASTAGVLAVADIAAGVLTAAGPIFIALALFETTRGFFHGWARALVGTMIATLVCWVTTCLLLVVLGPRIDTLAQQRASHAIALDAATSACAIVLVFAAAQALLVVASLLIAAGFDPRRRVSPLSIAPGSPARVREGWARGEVSLPLPAARAPDRLTAAAESRILSVDRAGASAPASRGGPDAQVIPPAARLGETYSRLMVFRDQRRPAAGVRA